MLPTGRDCALDSSVWQHGSVLWQFCSPALPSKIRTEKELLCLVIEAITGFKEEQFQWRERGRSQTQNFRVDKSGPGVKNLSATPTLSLFSVVAPGKFLNFSRP